MPNTSNFSLPYPQASDTVDVPRDIQALAGAVDTELVNRRNASVRVFASAAARDSAIPTPTEGMTCYLTDVDLFQIYTGSAWAAIGGTGATGNGLWLIKTQTIGSGVSSVTVNDAFSADYDNYKIIISDGVGSHNAELNMRIGATVANYHFNFIYTAWNSTVQADGSKVGTRWQYVGGMTNTNIIANIDVFSPHLPKATRIFAGGFGDAVSYAGVASGAMFDSNQYTSFTILPSFGTMTGGTIRIYGYRK